MTTPEKHAHVLIPECANVALLDKVFASVIKIQGLKTILDYVGGPSPRTSVAVRDRDRRQWRDDGGRDQEMSPRGRERREVGKHPGSRWGVGGMTHLLKDILAEGQLLLQALAAVLQSTRISVSFSSCFLATACPSLCLDSWDKQLVALSAAA